MNLNLLRFKIPKRSLTTERLHPVSNSTSIVDRDREGRLAHCVDELKPVTV